MAYALRRKGTDGRLADHWLKAGANFQSGETSTRLAQINAMNPDIAVWEIVSVPDTQLETIRNLVFAPERAAADAIEAKRLLDLANSKTKLKNALLRAASIDGLSVDEVDEFLRSIG